MSITDFFKNKGIKVLLEGNKPQVLDDPDSVWLVTTGKVSVFIAALSFDHQPG